MPLSSFHQPTRTWFERAFDAPTPVQHQGWPILTAGHHSLLVAPTGSGKTLAAFLAAIDRLGQLPAHATPGPRVVYISPLKALAHDVERNLRTPLIGIQRTAEALATALRPVGVDLRTGDTPQRERARQARAPGEILVTTPESLFLILTSRASANLRTVDTVIVDEVHALAPSKRGSHLALTLERLADLAETDPQRIGLSATVRPFDEVARFLGGDRPVEVVDAHATPRLDLEVAVPVPDMERPPPPEADRGGSVLGEMARESAPPERGLWPSIYPELLRDIQAHRSTIVFVNNRGLCERLAERLNALAGQELVRAHHGSVSHGRRAEIEEGLKAGTIRGIVATSSLELGIDMGAVELVVLVASPGSVARGLQRAGRAGHQIEAVSRARVYPKFRGDLLEAALIARRMLSGEIEATRVPRNPLDVLAQHLAAMCLHGEQTLTDIERLVRRAYPYSELATPALRSVAEMLAGGYPSADFADLRPLLSWDRDRDVLRPRRGTPMRVRMNAGTIPDRGNYRVQLGPDGPQVGELDEEMVFETRAGDNIMLGATTWHVEAIERNRVIVSPAPGEPGRLPFWRGEGPGRPLELGYALGAFVRHLAQLGSGAAEWLQRETPLDELAASNLAAYIGEQQAHTGALPTDRSIVIERFPDELGDWRVCLLTPFGARIHAPWAMALQRRLEQQAEVRAQVMYTDDGIVLRLAETDEAPDLGLLLLDPAEVEELVTEQLPDTALFAALFRENAARALLMPRRGPDQRSPLWAQRIRAQQLLATVRRYPGFPIVLETYRQALGDHFDLPGLIDLLHRIQRRQVRVHEVQTPSPSPFARSLVFAYVAAHIYEQDAPLAERRAQALSIDRGLLGELLGQAEMRELLDPDAIDEVEAELQHLTQERQVRDPDGLHDLLRRLGDLSRDEIRDRSAYDPQPWLKQLRRERRAIEIGIAAGRRWIAAADAGTYRDALGCMPPPGLPDSHLQAAPEPLAELCLRYARGHGPFQGRDLAQRLGLREGQVDPVLRGLEAEDRLMRGELRPGGTEPEWCEPGVLRQLKRRTLARLRREIAPVDAQTLGRFLPDWQGVGRSGDGEALETALAQLEGLPLPWSSLAQAILPARVPEFSLGQLDMLSATGTVVWVGHSPLGGRDGRILLYRRERVGQLLTPPPSYEPPAPIHEAILAHLADRGASFLTELEQAARHRQPDLRRDELEAALWDLVWAGQITNDTFSPLRGLATSGQREGRPRGWRGAGGRWSRVADLVDPAIGPTERALARAQMLLERYGVVAGHMARAEGLGGGYRAVHQVLQSMEDAGRIRRGYFVEGLGGSQFARGDAVERLRALRLEDAPLEPRAEDTLLLTATDPANPYGALLPWPDTGAGEARRPKRAAGAWVVLLYGRAVLYVAPGLRQAFTFPSSAHDSEQVLAAAFRSLHRLPRGRTRGRFRLEKIDGVPVARSPHYQLIQACGFERDHRGLTAAGPTF